MTLEMLPAGRGDCFLLRCTDPAGPTNILIDGGVARTYDDHLKSRLKAVNAAGEAIDLLVVSHIDADHIGGILRLVADNGASETPNTVVVREVWHNSYRHLELNGRDANEHEQRVVRERTPTFREAGDGPISGKEGSALAALLRRGTYRWNPPLGEAVCFPTALRVGCATITVLGPSDKELRALAVRWSKELMQMGVAHDATRAEAFEEAFENVLLARYDKSPGKGGTISAKDPLRVPDPDSYVEDTSPTNASSITILVEHGGRRCLFVGDAPASVVKRGLETAGFPLPLRLDVLKLSHHGSRNSTSMALLRLLQTDRVLVSTDGSLHRHPDLEALLWVLATQPQGVQLIFSHPSAEALLLASPQALERFGHSVLIGSADMPTRIELANAANC